MNETSASTGATAPRVLGFYWLTAFLSGAGVLVLELAATRALAPFFGQALFVWTNVIGLVLLGLALGATVGGRIADRHPSPAFLAAVLGVGALLVASAAFTPAAVARALLPDPLPLEAAQPFLMKGSFITTLVCFVPPVFVLGAVSPFLIRCATRDLNQVGSRAGLLSGAATLGSIAGTFLTSFVLLPRLGTRGSILAAAAVLAASALPLFWSGRQRAALIGNAALVLALGASLLVGSVRAARPGMAQGELLGAWDSRYQHIEIRQRAELGRVLALDEGHDSFHSVLPEVGVWTGAYYDAHSLLASQVGGEELSVLICGLAGGTHARQLLHAEADRALRIVGVELDPMVVEVCREHLGLPEDPRLEVVAGLDARVYVDHADERFDLLLVDCYSHQSFIPFHLASREFFEAARARLNDGGLIAANLSAHVGTDPVLQAIANTMATVFGDVVIAKIPDSANLLVYARRGGGTPLPADFDVDAVCEDWEQRQLLERMQAPTQSWRQSPDSARRVLEDARPCLELIQTQRMIERARRVLADS